MDRQCHLLWLYNYIKIKIKINPLTQSHFGAPDQRHILTRAGIDIFHSYIY